MTTFRRVQVDVTLDDIALGLPSSSEDCPVARALERTFPFTEVAALEDQLYIDGRAVTSPATVVAFIADFDSDVRPVPGPFTFGLQWDEDAGGWAAA
jgi:hypothetical protein